VDLTPAVDGPLDNTVDGTVDGALDGALDLTPRPAPPAIDAVRRRRRGLGPLLVAGLLVAAALIVWQFLTNATLFFCNADEVGHRSECSGTKRFRLQGTVVTGSIVQGAPMTFMVSYNGTTIPVSYDGEPGGIFKEDIPVVVEGHMTGSTFTGERILVKHSNDYKQKNPERVKDYSAT
jgi:cytochrome c-type biogenesis protein CcmE